MATMIGGMAPDAFKAAVAAELPAMPKAGRMHYLDESDALDPLAEKGAETTAPELEADQPPK